MGFRKKENISVGNSNQTIDGYESEGTAADCGRRNLIGQQRLGIGDMLISDSVTSRILLPADVTHLGVLHKGRGLYRMGYAHRRAGDGNLEILVRRV